MELSYREIVLIIAELKTRYTQEADGNYSVYYKQNYLPVLQNIIDKFEEEKNNLEEKAKYDRK
jgi:hypothetical protein